MYKVVNLYLMPIDSDVSRYKIEEQCNYMSVKGYELVTTNVTGPTNVMLVFRKR